MPAAAGSRMKQVAAQAPRAAGHRPRALDPRLAAGDRVEAAQLEGETQRRCGLGCGASPFDHAEARRQLLEQRLAQLVAQRAGPALLLEAGQALVGQAHQPLRLIDLRRQADRLERHEHRAAPARPTARAASARPASGCADASAAPTVEHAPRHDAGSERKGGERAGSRRHGGASVGGPERRPACRAGWTPDAAAGSRRAPAGRGRCAAARAGCPAGSAAPARPDR